MSTMQDSTLNRPGKSPRVLACVLCQQRKIKCDRKFPCANCTKSQVQCVPAAQLQRRRRRRFPERALLDQILKYEDLLQKNNVKFKSLHAITVEAEAFPYAEDGSGSESEQRRGTDASSLSTTARHDEAFEIRNFWHAMHRRFRDLHDDSDSSQEIIDETVMKKAWDEACLSDGSLIFGTHSQSNVSHLHPEPAQIFRLWQLFLDNVNPILRVIHTPTMQGRVVEAVSNMGLLTPTFEALMFSFYSMAILSIGEDECQAIFGASKSELLTASQFGCQQALLGCGFLRCSDRDCLTALFLYLVSLSSTTDLRALSSMLAIAIRIAQRMGIDRETGFVDCGVFESEMRRRLWWALALFDARIGQLADYKNQTLTPTWDCQIPLNVNDVDLRPGMEEPPLVHAQPTEAIFAVVRSAVGNFIRNTSAHLEFTAPALKPLAYKTRNSSSMAYDDLDELEKMVEGKYLRYCDPGNPIQFIAIWDTRSFMAKCRLVKTYSSPSISFQTTAEAEASVSYALRMLECDTKILTCPLTKGYRWMLQYQFPFPAYLHLAKDLELRPCRAHASQAWEVMSDNCEARLALSFPEKGPFFRLFATLILNAWAARENSASWSEGEDMPPRIVSQLRNALAEKSNDASIAQQNATMEVEPDSFTMLMGFGGGSLLDQANDIGEPVWGAHCDMPRQFPFDTAVDQFSWGSLDWESGQRPTY